MSDIPLLPMIVPTIAAAVSLLLGLFGLLFPRRAAGLVGIALDPARPESISEIRATYGGVFTGASLAALMTGHPYGFFVLGLGWGFAFLARLVSTLVDRVPLRANLMGLALEFVIAISLITSPDLLGFLTAWRRGNGPPPGHVAAARTPC